MHLRLRGSTLLSRLSRIALRQTAVSGILRIDVQRHVTGGRRVPVHIALPEPLAVPAGSHLPDNKGEWLCVHRNGVCSFQGCGHPAYGLGCWPSGWERQGKAQPVTVGEMTK